MNWMNWMSPLFMFLSVASVALFSFVAVAAWSDARRQEREAYYKSETLKKIAESQGPGATAALELMREEDRLKRRRTLEGQKLGGIITALVGIGMMFFLHGLDTNEPAYLVGLVPTFVGVALLIYAYLMAPKD